MSGTTRFAAVMALAASIHAQPPARVEFKCTDDDLLAIGLACPEAEPCPVYLELSFVETVGSKLFVTGNLHTDSATLYSVLLSSADGGATWTEPHERIRHANLEQIQFIDFEFGWIAGQSLLGVPRDPFVLLTRDGGKTWRAAPITEEGRPGSIERFWFDSRNSGAMIVDRLRSAENGARHELYESMTGGESWSLKEASSRPIPLKRSTAAPNADWRLRADAASRSYRLERRQGAAWPLVATFPIRAGECKAREPLLAEPPEPQPADAEPSKPKPDEPPGPAKRPATKPTLQRKRPVRQ